jgi:serine/threonine protein kinase
MIPQRLEEPALVWQRLKHPNVSEFYGLSFNFGYMPALVLPFYGNGNVVDHVRQKDNDAKLDMARQIAEGLNYLHENFIVHGDLRGVNILVDESGSARICDYGLASIIEPPDFLSIETAGACRWTAPEIMNPADNKDLPPKYAERSDIYAFGMTLFEIFTGMVPFSQLDDNSVRSHVLNGGRPELSPSLAERHKKIIQDCWVVEADGRPTSRVIRKRLAPTRSLNAGGTCLWSHNAMGEHRDPRNDNDTFDKVAPVFPDAANIDVRRSSFTAVGRDSNCPIHFEFNFYVAGHFCIILLIFLFVVPLFSFGCSPLQG